MSSPSPTTGSPVAIINGVRYVPENAATTPDSVSIYYMHDNCTFSPLKGSVEQIIEQARAWARKSPYGMLTTACLCRGKTEVRRVGKCVHTDKEELRDTTEWENAIRNDSDVMRLLQGNVPSPATGGPTPETSTPR